MKTTRTVIESLLWACLLGVIVFMLMQSASGGDLSPARAAWLAIQQEAEEKSEPAIVPTITLNESTDIGKALKIALPRQCFVVAIQDHCPPCETFKRTIACDLVKLGWSIRYVRIDRESDEDLSKWLNITATPTILAMENGVEVDGIEGLPESAQECTDLFKRGVAIGPPEQPGNEVMCYRVVGGWTWPGAPSSTALRVHLCSHPHNRDPVSVYGWTPEQCVREHDAHHNQIGAWPPGGNDRKAMRRARRGKVTTEAA